MSPRVRPSSTVRLVLRAVCLFGVLAGIFGMHGLAAHGAAGGDLFPQALMSQAAPAMHATNGSDMATTGASQMDAAASALPVTNALRHATSMPDHDDSMGMGMAGLCVAILLVGIVALSLWLARHRPRSWTVASVRFVRLIEQKGRVLPPPSLHALSIQRC